MTRVGCGYLIRILVVAWHLLSYDHKGHSYEGLGLWFARSEYAIKSRI